MAKFWHYLGNIAGAILSLALYVELQVFYFYPQKIRLDHMRALVTALVTVVVLFVIFNLYKRQLKEHNDWGFNQTPHWDMRRIGMLNSVGRGVSNNQQALDKIELHSKGLFEIMVVFIAPFCEEVIFRGMFFNIFFTKKKITNKLLGIIVSGFLFAYMHDPMLSKFIFVYWGLGMVLAWVYMQTKDLRYSMLVHMCYNAMGFIG